MLQVVVFQIGNQVIAEAPCFQWGQVILLAAPHLINGIEVLGTDAGICFEADIVLRLHEVEEVVIVPLDKLPVAPGAVAFSELKAILDKTLQALKSPQKNPFGLGGHLLGDVRVVHPVGRLDRKSVV